MRSYVLNGKKVNAAQPPAAYDYTDITTPAGIVREGPPQRSTGFDIEKAKKWFASGKALQAAGAAGGNTFDYGGALAAATAGAAAGTAIPGVGTVVGAIVAVAVFVVNSTHLFSGGPSQWDTAAPGVHWFFTNLAPQAFLDYVNATGSVGAFGSMQDAAKAYLVWRLTQEQRVAWPGHVWYSGVDDERYVWTAYAGGDTYDATRLQAAYDLVDQLYDDLGVDWHATTAVYQSESGYGPVMLMKNRVLLTDADQQPDADQSGTGAGDGGKIAIGLAIAAGAAYIATR